MRQVGLFAAQRLKLGATRLSIARYDVVAPLHFVVIQPDTVCTIKGEMREIRGTPHYVQCNVVHRQ